MDTWPEYADRAFRMVYYGGQYEKALEAFVQRWGGLDIQTFRRVLKAGTHEEKVIALFALGYSGQEREQLLSFLQNPEPMERWASALVLGEIKEEHALPVLVALLDEFLPPQVDLLSPEGGQYHFWRIKAVSLLGEWGRRELVPVLHRALEKAWDIEQQILQPAHKQAFHSYQDELAYALGRLGAFGALTDLGLPTARLQLEMVHLACGAIQAQTRYGDLLTQLQINRTLKEEVAQVLETRFGLSAEEQTSSIEQYADEYFARMEQS